MKFFFSIQIKWLKTGRAGKQFKLLCNISQLIYGTAWTQVQMLLGAYL